LYRLVIVNGDSMIPTLHSGDRVLVRLATLRRIRQSDLVVFARPRTETGWMIKRVVALPGDVIPRRSVPALWGYPGSRVPPDRFVVLGDNPAESYDSRSFGYLTGSALLGVVVRRLRPAKSA